jgi:hypothetical protein
VDLRICRAGQLVCPRLSSVPPPLVISLGDERVRDDMEGAGLAQGVGLCPLVLVGHFLVEIEVETV